MSTVQTTTGRSLGIGLTGITDWSTEVPFIDAFKSARGWIPQRSTSWNTDEAIDVDANGWVRSLPSSTINSANDKTTDESTTEPTFVGTLLLHNEGRYRSGRYVVLYDGEGTIQYGFDAQKISAESQPGRDVLQIDSSGKGGIYLTIHETDPNQTGEYIRNIRVYHEDDLPLVEMGIHFNPSFLQKIKEFGTLRFMDWMDTNHSKVKDWDDRPKLSHSSWAGKGAPIELMVELANKTGCSPWFNMPHQATDDYIRQFATYVRDHLDPRLTVYVEFSNEVWNWQFDQSHYALQQAEERWGEVEGGYMQWYGVRSAETAEIWKSVFAEQSDRLTTLISTQTGWKGLENYALNTPAWVAEGNEPAWKSVDAYAITGYFSGALGNPENIETVRSWLAEPDGGFEKAFEQLKTGTVIPGTEQDSVEGTIELFNYHANVAKQHGLQLVAYEGGQHIVGFNGTENDAELSNFFMELNRHPEMESLYQRLLEGWKEADGTLFAHFVGVGSYSKWGSWGALEHLEQTNAPKYDALMDFIATHDRWWDESASGVKLGLHQQGTSTGESIDGSEDSDILLGGEGDDSLVGGEGHDSLHGGMGNDFLNGGNGDDVLMGGDGDDVLIGGFGFDVLTGGTGADRFVYSGNDRATAHAHSVIPNPDRITDFNPLEGDRIQLDYDNDLLTPDLPAGLFHAGVRTERQLGQAIEAAFAEKIAVASKAVEVNKVEADKIAVADKSSKLTESRILQPNEAVILDWQDQRYLIVNDETIGFSATHDLVIDVTGMQMHRGDPNAGVLVVNQYFG
jgi:hypothetical protein